jgi:hypothetical protein
MNTIIMIAMLFSSFGPQQTQHVVAKATLNSVTLQWSAGSLGANCASPATLSYNVFRGTAAGQESTTPINTSPVTALTYVDSNGLVAGTTYFYNVKSVELCGTTSISSLAASNEVSALIPLPTTTPPAAPTNLQVVPGSVSIKRKKFLGIFPRSASNESTVPAPEHALTLSWNRSTTPGTVYYWIYRDHSNVFDYVKINASPLFCDESVCHYYDNNGLVAGSAHTYEATSWTPVGGESGFSNKTVSVTIP